jgi:hypothetical protein
MSYRRVSIAGRAILAVEVQSAHLQSRPSVFAISGGGGN